VQDCQVCGRRFDPLGFQVVVPELARGFDRIECAQSARAHASPGSRIVATTPLVAVLEPIGLPLARATAIALRPLGAPAATLGLLAAGTAAAVLLWLRVVGTDSANFPFTSAAPPAVAQETVESYVEPVPLSSEGPVAGLLRERSVPVSVTAIPAAVREPPHDPAARQRHSSSRGSAHPSGARRAASNAPRAAAKATGKDHAKRGQGHYKHGETAGIHKPGHGGGHGKGHGKH
jgi:hypothetical protein